MAALFFAILVLDRRPGGEMVALLEGGDVLRWICYGGES
jgi:hypothetical protein